VGADVLQAFGVDARTGDDARFVARPRPDGSLRWRAHLQRLARDRLEAAGLVDISADDSCTVEDASRFFSFRRDGVTGRMAAAVWRL
ncbi:MAG: laccase domain-containing protein, partial [Burkholderiales bacterium]|nr:laccase domain-containing protein [Burkholderiales bacterium]